MIACGSFVQKDKDMNTLGRNDPCFCGSGKKYKKCCLPHEEQAYRRKTSEDLAQEFLDQDPSHQFVQSEDVGTYKLSEVILEYGSDLLEAADTDQKKEEVICICIAAWNLSWLSEDQRPGAIDVLLEKMKVQDSHAEYALRELLAELIICRQTEYPFYNRFIYKFSLQDGGDEMYFSVLSRDVPLLTEEGKEYLSQFFH